MKNLSITDLIDIHELQQLQDAFADANGVAATITQVNGEPITAPSNHSGVCCIIRQTEKGLANCIRSGKILGRISMKTDEPNYHSCHSVGFIDAAAPIVVDGVHIANWLIGQYCIGRVDERRIVSYAREIDADPKALLAAFRQMKKIPEQEFTAKLHFLWLMAGQISAMAYEKSNLQKMYTMLEKSQKELRQHKKYLEHLVGKKTQSLKKTNEALRKEIVERKNVEKHRNKMIIELQQALKEVKTLGGLLPICMHCKKIRDDKGYWNQIEAYIHTHSDARFSHSICRECEKTYYSDMDLDEG